MKINILVPGRGARASGGVKVLYHHANGLAQRGHEVTLIHAPFGAHDGSALLRARRKLVHWGTRSGVLPWRPDGWFQLRDDVACLWLARLDAARMPRADATVASFWHNADWLCGAPARLGRKCYLVQEFEYYKSARPPERARMSATFRAGLSLLSISPAVTAMLRECGVAGCIANVPNGVEHEVFYQTLALDDAARDAVGFPARPESFKATPDAVAALTEVRGAFPDLRVWSFGWKRPRYLPPWVEFHERVSSAALRELYNQSMVFLVPSHYEGWGLPGAEAMACASALVSTDTQGVHAYAQDGETALLAPPGDVPALAAHVMTLLRAPARRTQLAAGGQRAVAALTWECASDALDAALGEPHARAVRSQS